MKMLLTYNSFTGFFSCNCAHYFFECIKIMQYPASFLVLICYILMCCNSHCGCTRYAGDIMWWGLLGVFWVCLESTEIPPFTVFLATCHSFTYIKYTWCMCICCYLSSFRISVVQIYCIPCVGVVFLCFRYRKAFKAHSRNLFLHIAHVCLYMHIHKCIFTSVDIICNPSTGNKLQGCSSCTFLNQMLLVSLLLSFQISAVITNSNFPRYYFLLFTFFFSFPSQFFPQKHSDSWARRENVWSKISDRFSILPLTEANSRVFVSHVKRRL